MRITVHLEDSFDTYIYCKDCGDDLETTDIYYNVGEDITVNNKCECHQQQKQTIEALIS